jgi:hypothetical protein
MFVVGRITAMSASTRGTPIRQTTKQLAQRGPGKVGGGFLFTTNHIWRVGSNVHTKGFYDANL